MGDERPRTRYCGRCLNTFQTDLEVCPNLPCRANRPDEGWGVIFEAGEIIDRHYRVRRRLATGGAGVTYLAAEVEPETEEEACDLAVKVLWATRDHGSYLRRLSQEAQILQELDHPNIVEYRGFVHRTGHAPYLVTRFEQGGSLFDHVRRRTRLGLRETASIGRQVLEALGRAHQAGVIHRDLKPENVLLQAIPEPGESPHVLVADFGIAKVQGLFSDGLTRVGAFVGTPQYAAPEQFDGLQPTPATDVFATGAMLYFCLQGQPLLPLANRLPAEDARELLIRKLPARLVLPDEKPEQVKAVEQVLEAAMAVEAGERITVREMHGMLEAIEHGSFLLRPTRTAVPTRSRTSSTNIFLFSQDGLDDDEAAPTDQGAPPPRDEPPPPPPRDEPPPPPPRDEPPPPPPRDEPPPPPTDGGDGFGAPAVDLPLEAKPAGEAPPPPAPRSEPRPEPAAPARSRGRLPALFLGGLLLAGLCGGGGVVGLLLYRPDLLEGIPGVEDLVDNAGGRSSEQALEQAIQARLDTLATQGVVHCGLHARVTLQVSVTPSGVVVPGEAAGIPVPKKARCFESYMGGFVIKPPPPRELKLTVEVPG
jgi:serine/threonine protein kinase